ncbi:MAG TPA: ATP-dependent DNA helicase RecQ [Terracidiphilus sp.]|nr:ATP-dependent DNA helicase RecQ [Terracidiphilus sp.]
MTTPPHSDRLAELLQTVFGFSGFRANQEPVCRAALAGHDVLLVMPTGSGKSLCYQLPAIALEGTALVVSPLIALMDDQAAKLTALGLRVARIHSGLDRAVARQACVDYLRGDLQFLFIAPERLRVPGFPEMLAKRKPALIAIDEAHCISQWGHEFRPDYRMLGQYLPALRPAPVLALTATATPTVQADIVVQLGMSAAQQFVHGFRRENLAIEVVEVPVPERARIARMLLADAARRPAIIYAPSRRLAEGLAEELSRAMPAGAYHAGLDAGTRERVQSAFQRGELEVVVATIAFGMGIDKADIRTVIHAGLPGTVEGYYQEIGRAGRDGAPSRTFLMHSYADQRTHDFFLNRDYPPADHLQQVFSKLTEDAQPIDALRTKLKLTQEEFDKALEKLEIHGGARVDFSGTAAAGGNGWKKTYSIQAQFRAEQIQRVLRFVESSNCRMAELVRHFGDEEDASKRCGVCDVCDPEGAVLRQFRRAHDEELRIVESIAAQLRGVDYKATGTLQRAVDPAERLSRGSFDAVLDAMARAGLIAIENAEYEKDGQVRRFRKVSLCESERDVHSLRRVELLISDGIASGFLDERARPERGRTLTKSTGKSPSKVRRVALDADDEAPVTAASEALAVRLQAWRTAEAKRLGVPAFVVMHDRTLRGVAHARPRTPNHLLAVNGMGPAKVEKFGGAILELCAQSD